MKILKNRIGWAGSRENYVRRNTYTHPESIGGEDKKIPARGMYYF